MKRLWLTDEQAGTLSRALNSQVFRLRKCAKEEEDLSIKAKYIEEAVKISDIIDIIEM